MLHRLVLACVAGVGGLVGSIRTNDRDRVVGSVRGLCVPIVHGCWAAHMYGARGSAHATQGHNTGHTDHPGFVGDPCDPARDPL